MSDKLSPGTVLKGIGTNVLKKREIVRVNAEKTGYIYKDPLNLTAPGKEYDSSDGLDPWFLKNWVPEVQPEKAVQESKLNIRAE